MDEVKMLSELKEMKAEAENEIAKLEPLVTQATKVINSLHSKVDECNRKIKLLS